MKILVIGAGIAGCSISRMLCEKNEIHIIEKNNFIGGNCYDFQDETSTYFIHQYGPHIFHTSNDAVWEFVNKFSHFNKYINQVLVKINDNLIEMPINLNSIRKLFPSEFQAFYDEIASLHLLNSSVNIADLLNKLHNEQNKKIIQYFYDNVFANYTCKMWGIDIKDIDKNIINRVKVNLNYEWNYFPNDKYCGLPNEGYHQMMLNMIDHPNINVQLNSTNMDIKFTNNEIYVNGCKYDYVIYTGSIDELFDYKYGQLNYRSLYIEFRKLKNSEQQKPIVNYPQHKTMTRICDYKLLTSNKTTGETIISLEYPGQFNINDTRFNKRYYPINNENNINTYKKYLKDSKNINNLILLGRLAEYKYYDMDEIIEKCFEIAKKLINSNLSF